VNKNSLIALAAIAAMSQSTSSVEYELDRAARRARNRKPKAQMYKVPSNRRRGNIRNSICECGSGIKYKKCCYLTK